MNWLVGTLLAVGAVFYVVGTVGMLRFRDVYLRLHALAKVDNLGLGFVVLALALRADSAAVAAKLALIWVLALAASSTSAWLLADVARRHGIPCAPTRRDDAP